MTQYAFGTGKLILKRTDIINTMPAVMGVLQENSVDFSQKLESLLGQYKLPVAIAGAELSIKGKAKFARLQATQLNNLFLGGTLTSGAGIDMADSESGTVASAAVTVANGATFVEDLGVFNAAGTTQLQPVASAPATGVSYVPGVAGVGTYTFNAGDNATSYLFNYSYTTASGNKIVVSNQLMGAVPTFELYFKESFVFLGATKNIVIKLNACSAEKLTLPFANTKFTIAEFDWMAQADASNNIGTIAMTE